MIERSADIPKDPSDTLAETSHGLTPYQIEQLFAEAGEFASLNEAWEVLLRKAQFAAQWLCSYWTADIPQQVKEAIEEDRAYVANHQAQWEIDDPESLAEYLADEQKREQEDAQDENTITNQHPLMGFVTIATSIPAYDRDYQVAKDTYQAVCEVAIETASQKGTDEKAKVDYAIAVIEAYGDSTWSSNNKEGAITHVTFPDVLPEYKGRMAFYPTEDRLF